MQLHEVDEIVELFLVDDVNQALTEGWRIVAVGTSAEPGVSEVPVLCYVLGRAAQPAKETPRKPAGSLVGVSTPRRR
ncbi:hypothetical protein BV330_00034 [Pseudomonas syringae pv. actinidiae]|nr:hypothetical protein BV330_00034 [Pseudomonas syringae pv. actinidiae]OSR98492.1 hypothetical protein BV331_00032 [Pseudomonas syringae pv. actinidiae]